VAVRAAVRGLETGTFGRGCAPALDLRYVYDGADNVRSLENLAVANSSRTMTYDALDRLRSVSHPLGGVASYQYDPLGNRTWGPIRDISMRFEYDERNRLAWASQELKTSSSTFVWDAANRLVASSDGATYRYDGLDRRVAKTEAGQTIVYHHDASGRLIAETTPEGLRLRDYLYLGDKLIAVQGCMEGASSSGCTLRQWYHTDTLGSVLARTDASGTIVTRFDYRAWGERATVDGVEGDRQYNGRVYDSGTGFRDYGARMYWPEIGRFVSADSHDGEIANPASLNRYSYVWNNPYKYVDPDGHQTRPPPRRLGAGSGPTPDLHAAVRAARMGNALARIRSSGARTPDTIGPGGPPSETAVRQMESLAETVDPRPNPASPALRGTPYSPEAVNAHVRPEYRPNPAHDPRSNAFDFRKTPEPPDAATVYLTAIRADMGTWFGRGEAGWYRYSSDNAGGAHFSGIVPTARVPAPVVRGR